MKVLEKEKVVTRKGHTRVARAVAAPRAVAYPTVSLRTQTVARPSLRRNAVLAEWSNRAVAFAVLAGLTYVGSTLGGYVMLERARQSARHGADRAAFAQAEAKEARASIEALSNPASLAAWAKSHGFVAGSTATTEPHGSDLVAKD